MKYSHTHRVHGSSKIMLVLIALLCVNMGNGSQTNTSKEPRFAALQDGHKSYKAAVTVNGVANEVRDISFSGKTNLGGIRREQDTVIIEIDLAKVRELKIISKSYFSDAYPDKHFLLVDAVAYDGTALPRLLFPPDIILSAVSISAGLELAWRMQDIDKIVMHHLIPA